MKPGDEWYVVIASDGVWEFLTPADLSKVVGKKLRLKGVDGCEYQIAQMILDARWATANLIDFSHAPAWVTGGPEGVPWKDNDDDEAGSARHSGG